MDFSVCSQCSIEIEGKGIHFRNSVFCSDNCCEEFEEEFAAKGEPGLDDLGDEEDADLSDDDLGYQDEEPETKDNLLDDDYDISPEDF